MTTMTNAPAPGAGDRGSPPSGSAEAHAASFDRHATAIYNYCFRRTGSWSTAEDLTSVVFLEAWRRRHDAVLLDGSELPWLYGIARGVTRNSSRSLRRHRAALARVPQSPYEPDPADGVVDRVSAERHMTLVLQALAKLPTKNREVLELSVWGELDHQSIATVLGVPVGTVKSRLSRAREQLRAAVAALPIAASLSFQEQS